MHRICAITNHTSTGKTMSTSSIDLFDRLRAERLAVETFYRAFSDRNPDLVDEVLAPTWDDIPLAPGQGPGPEGINPIIQSVVQAFPDVQITVNDMVREPGKIGVRAEISGTHQGQLFGIAAHVQEGELPPARVPHARWQARDRDVAHRGLVRSVPPTRAVPAASQERVRCLC